MEVENTVDISSSSSGLSGTLHPGGGLNNVVSPYPICTIPSVPSERIHRRSEGDGLDDVQVGLHVSSELWTTEQSETQVLER